MGADFDGRKQGVGRRESAGEPPHQGADGEGADGAGQLAYPSALPPNQDSESRIVASRSEVVVDTPRNQQVAFDPKRDSLIVTFDGGDDNGTQTIAAMKAGGKFEPTFVFAAADPEGTKTMGRPITPKRSERGVFNNDAAAPAAVIDVANLPADYAAQREKARGPKNDHPKTQDPMSFMSRGQLTWKRSADGSSIVIYNGVWDTTGTFVPALNPVKIASQLVGDWEQIADVPRDKGARTPEACCIELAPREGPYYLRLPNYAVLVVSVTPQKPGEDIPAQAVSTKPPPDPAPVRDRMEKLLAVDPEKAFGGVPSFDVVTLVSKPSLPNYPHGNHYVGKYNGVVVQDGQVYVSLTGAGGRVLFYLADRIDFSKAQRGIPARLIGPGPDNFLDKRLKRVNPDVEKFNPDGDVKAQIEKYIGNFAHPVEGGEYWHTYAQQAVGCRLGGNLEGAQRITMPDGSSAVAKTYSASANSPATIEKVIAGIRRMEVWASQGRGPRVYGVGYAVSDRTPARVSITVLMENMTPQKVKASDMTILVRDAAFISPEAAALPRAARIWLRDSLLLISREDQHPDGHFLNVGYRIRHLRSDADLPAHGNYYRYGNQVVEVYAVDAAGALADQTIAAGSFLEVPQRDRKKYPGPLAQYDPGWKREFLDRELRLVEQRES